MNDVAARETAAAVSSSELDAGAKVVLDQPTQGWVVQSGNVELYASLYKDGQIASGRRFLCAMPAGALIPPLLTTIPDLRIAIHATEPSALLPVSMDVLRTVAADAAKRPALAAQLDRWFAGLGGALSIILGPVPTEARSLPVGESVAASPGTVITARSGAVWLGTGSGGLSLPDGSLLPNVRSAESCVGLVTPGTWLTAASSDSIVTLSTASVLGSPIWRTAIEQTHKHALEELQRSLVEHEAKARAAASDRSQRLARTVDHVIGRIRGVLEHAPAWTGVAAPEQQLLGPMVLVCEMLGVELTAAVRERIGRATTVEAAARTARMPHRQIALRGDWWKQDFGPFIGFLDDARIPVAVLPTGRRRWKVVDPQGGPDLVVNAALAARLGRTAHMLYRPLPSRPLGWKDLLNPGSSQSRRDLVLAVLSAIAIGALGLATPVAMRLAFDRFIPAHEVPQLAELAIGLALAALITAAFRIAYDMAFLRIDGRMGGQVHAAIIDRVLHLPLRALNLGSADLAMRASSAEGVRRGVMNAGLASLSSLFIFISNGTLLFYYAPGAATMAVAGFGIVLIFACLISRLQLGQLRRGEQLLSDVNTIVLQLVNGISVLRTSGAEARAFARWGQDFAEMRARAHRSHRVSSILETMLAGFDVLTMAGVLLLLSFMPTKDLSTGSFVSFISAYAVFAAAAAQLARSLAAIVALQPSWERAAPLLRAVPEGGSLKRDPGMLSGAVELSNVVYRYGPEAPFAVAGVSIKIAAGEFVALVGASGSGKSTIARLLLGVDAPLQGSVQYDEVDLRHLDIDLVRRQIGVVLQHGKLLPGTIFDNIMGTHAGTLEDAWEAVRHAGLEADIKALPMGLHTMLTEATAAFSGGQVQRMLLARALVGRPRLLLLDEATSALDNINQAIVAASLARLAITRIVIAHRLATVRQADRIYVLDRGRLVQQGTFDELMAQPGPFTELAHRQLL